MSDHKTEQQRKLELLKLKHEQMKKEYEKAKSKIRLDQKSNMELFKEKFSQKANTGLTKEEQERIHQRRMQDKRKKFEESLKQISDSEYFPGIHPECYDERTQCTSDREDRSEEEDEGSFKNEQKINKKEYIVKKKKHDSNNPIILTDTTNVNIKVKKEEIVEEQRDILKDFLKKKAVFIEKALNEEEIVNLFGKEDKYLNEDNEDNTLYDDNVLTGTDIEEYCEFKDKSSRKRIVTNVEISTNYRELLLASYSKGDEFDFNQQNGLINLWSFALRKFPEFTFSSENVITTAIFHPFYPNLVIGGTLSGQIFLWDIRTKSIPCAKSQFGCANTNSDPSATQTHGNRIECLAVVGTVNSNQIISLSEGLLCKWSQISLDKPIKSLALYKKQKKLSLSDIGTKSKLNDKTPVDLGVSSIGYQVSDTNSILIGTDDKEIYQVSLVGDDNKDKESVTYEGHSGPVLSVDIHPTDIHNKCIFGNLFLTSSSDWTTNIYSKNQRDKPIFTIDSNDDSIYSSKWCPIKASVFACGDGSGHIDFWDLIYSRDVPKVRYTSNEGNDIITKLCWIDDGKKIIYGNNDGSVKVISLGKDIYTSKVEDSLKFDELLNKYQKKY